MYTCLLYTSNAESYKDIAKEEIDSLTQNAEELRVVYKEYSGGERFYYLNSNREEAIEMCIRDRAGDNTLQKVLDTINGMGGAFVNPFPSFMPGDLLVGVGCGIGYVSYTHLSERFDKERGTGGGLVVHHTRNLRFCLGFDRQAVAAVAHRDDSIL